MPTHPPGRSDPRWARLLDRCARVLDAQRIAVPEPFDLNEFTAGLAQRRGRPIRLTRIRLPAAEATVCGLCFGHGRTDCVYYTETLSSLHRSHNAVHELSHLVLGHESVAPRTGDGLDTPVEWWFAGVEATYSAQSEEEADAMAAVVLSGSAPRPRRWVSSSAVRAGAGRLSDALRP